MNPCTSTASTCETTNAASVDSTIRLVVMAAVYCERKRLSTPNSQLPNSNPTPNSQLPTSKLPNFQLPKFQTSNSQGDQTFGSSQASNQPRPFGSWELAVGSYLDLFPETESRGEVMQVAAMHAERASGGGPVAVVARD